MLSLQRRVPCRGRSRRMCPCHHAGVRDSVDRAVLRWSGICLDCADAEEMAQFYADVFGWQTVDRDEPPSRSGRAGWILMRQPDGGPTVSLQAERWYQPPTWPEEAGAQTKMMHFEVAVDDLETAVRLVQEAGGRVAPHQPPDRDLNRLRIMLDPAGHPFCLYQE